MRNDKQQEQPQSSLCHWHKQRRLERSTAGAGKREQILAIYATVAPAQHDAEPSERARHKRALADVSPLLTPMSCTSRALFSSRSQGHPARISWLVKLAGWKDTYSCLRHDSSYCESGAVPYDVGQNVQNPKNGPEELTASRIIRGNVDDEACSLRAEPLPDSELVCQPDHTKIRITLRLFRPAVLPLPSLLLPLTYCTVQQLHTYFT
jgi:hypothetical protein